ncbi:uncharacterized protein [Nicotiana tomentosiformis]|uniref:uncharacterized protein n=1 Tax=Nicotiana tomentosiformis TaxID=4098 RepID=UPI00388C5E5D
MGSLHRGTSGPDSLEDSVAPYLGEEDTYCPPAIQGPSSGYSGHQGQTSCQQSTVLRGCFECGDLGHVKRFCPRLWGKAEQQDYQPMITTPAAAPAVWPPRGEGQVGRGCPKCGGQSNGILAIFYVFLARPDSMITGIISVCGRDVTILFDPGSTYSYVSTPFAHFLGVPRESLGIPLYVSTPMGDSVVVDHIYRSCIVTFCGYETRADLLLLDMINFEVILGIEWLSPCHDVLDCHAKTITLAIPELPRLEWKGSCVSASSWVISFLKSRHMVEKGCLAYLAYVRDTAAETPTINSVPMVREFSDVFPSNLPGMPLDRDIYF